MGWELLSYETSEAAGTVTVCAILTGQIERDVSVTATSADGTAIGIHTSCTKPISLYIVICKLFQYSAVVSDYAEVSISLVFTQQNADQPQCITIPITNDNVLDLESIETFSAELSTSDPDVFLSPSSAMISILDNEGMMSYSQ